MLRKNTILAERGVRRTVTGRHTRFLRELFNFGEKRSPEQLVAPPAHPLRQQNRGEHERVWPAKLYRRSSVPKLRMLSHTSATWKSTLARWPEAPVKSTSRVPCVNTLPFTSRNGHPPLLFDADSFANEGWQM